jgi:MFS transporter, DHA1 family, tetracycline resistance protein
MANRKQLFSIFFIVFIDLLGFSLILPLLPFYAETFGASPFIVGLLVAIYAAAQLIGAPILGRLSDRFGRRPILLISIAGSFLGFILLASARSLVVLFLARALDGLTGGNISVAQAYITDVTDEKNRSRGLGLIGAAFGLGFIIGPAVGGILSRWGFAVPAYAAAALSAINLMLVALWLQESLTPERRKALAQAKRPPLSFAALWKALRRPYVGQLLHTRFFFGLTFSTFQTIFALYGQYRFNLNSQNTGYILAYVGLLSVIVQGFLVGKLTARFSDNGLILLATALMSGSLLAWALAPSIPVLLLVLIPTALAGGTLNTVINSALTKSVSSMEIGGTLGLSAALESLTRVIAPTLGGIELQSLGTAAPGLISAVILVWLTWYVYQHIWRREKLGVQPEKSEV